MKEQAGVPEDGWVVTFEEAQEKAKENSTAQANLRVATAACRLRKWKEAKAAASRGLSKIQTDADSDADNKSTKKSLQRCQTIACKGLVAVEEGERDCPFLGTVRGKLFAQPRFGIRNLFHPTETFSNLTLLQWAATTGNCYALEQVVALGASLDLPAKEMSLGHGIPNPAPNAPSGSTALVLICASLAVNALMVAESPFFVTPPQVGKTLQGMAQCAILLVKLGADVSKKLPNDGRIETFPSDHPASAWERYGLYGKTAKELAILSKKTRLIQAMEEFKTKEDLISKAYCRCGSRLPWLHCHAGPEIGRSPICKELPNDDLGFRYSPLAPCPCNLTKKNYWRCCWQLSAAPAYLCDSDGVLSYTQSVSREETIESGGDPNQLPLLQMDILSNEFLPTVAEAVRTRRDLMVPPWLHNTNSIIPTWNLQVFAGCIERLNFWFTWTDLHWDCEKAILLVKVKEWNTALEKYCDDSGLTGAERQLVFDKHKASPYAPCGKFGCKSVESKVKEFQRCSRCKKIAYCGLECQRSDWPRHKEECIPS